MTTNYKDGKSPLNKQGEFRQTEMTDNQILALLNRKREDWIRIADSFLNDKYISEDIIQEVYLKLTSIKKLKKCIDVFEDGSYKINKSYMYLTIRSVSYDYLKAKSKATTEYLVFDNDAEGIYDDTDTNEVNESMGAMLDKMEDVIANCDWYDRQIFDIYRNSGLSMQKLSEDIGISKTSINTSVQKVKTAIREALKEDYQDFKNEDYELINY